ncbi:hypothetical protein D3C72_1789830 [compost metagenome]
MAISSAQLKAGKSSWPRTTTSTFSARKPLKGAAMILASMVKLKNTSTTTNSTNSGQRMYSRKLSQSGRLGMKASTQPLNSCIAKPIRAPNSSRLTVSGSRTNRRSPGLRTSFSPSPRYCGPVRAGAGMSGPPGLQTRRPYRLCPRPGKAGNGAEQFSPWLRP